MKRNGELKGRDAIKRDLDRLDSWASANCMRFTKSKCKLLHLGQAKPRHKYKLNTERVEGRGGLEDVDR